MQDCDACQNTILQIWNWQKDAPTVHLVFSWQLQRYKQNIETNPIFFGKFVHFCKFVHAHICACTQLSCPYECGRGTWHAAAGNTTAAEAPAATLPRWLSHHDQQPSAETSVQPVFAVCILPFDTIPTSASVPTRVGLLGSFKQRAFRAWHASRDLRDAPYSTKSLAICCSRNKDTPQPSSWGLLSSRLSVGQVQRRTRIAQSQWKASGATPTISRFPNPLLLKSVGEPNYTVKQGP